MRKIFIHLLSLAIFAMFSCSRGLSDSTAIEIAESTDGFGTTECMLLRINTTSAATKDSRYVTDGVVIRERTKTDEEIHSHGLDEFLPLVLTDSDGKIVKILGNYLLMQIQHRFGGACNGCQYCYEKFAEKGLLKIQWIDEKPTTADYDKLGYRQCKITLTPEGEKYVVVWDEPNKGSELLSNLLNSNTGDAVAVKLMERVYTRAEKITQTEKTGEYNLYYYNEMTPFGEVIFGPTNKSKEYKCAVRYYKNSDGEWKVSVAKDDLPGSQEREF